MWVSRYVENLGLRVLACFAYLLFIGCGSEQEVDTTPPTPTVDTVFQRVTVDRLRMRDAPGLGSKTVTLLPEGVLVKYWNKHSPDKTTITLRDSSITEYWYLVDYADTTGWVFGGALAPMASSDGADYIIIPGHRVGEILASDSEQDIVDRLGVDQVDRGEFMIGEGDFVEATYVYPSSEKELILLWHEGDFNHLREIRIRRSDSPWTTEEGITVGSTLKEVEAVNQSPFLLNGFGWDYAGSTLDWQSGILDDDLTLVFAEPNNVHRDLLGDQSYPSDHKRMQSADPEISVIRVLFSN
ncbi:MAG: SH3 domain-containing protein [Saprospiraceae bacterium]|nr:SH3 domain-containing protein [Saprospiraceae bacterium]